MDRYSFINSNAIAEHCRKIGHPFTPVEMAYLIHFSEKHTIPEKHDAFRELMETTTDMELEERHWTPHFHSFHNFLEKYMEIENKYIDRFYRDEPDCVYSFQYLHKADSDYTEDEGIYPDFQTCYESIKVEIDEPEEIRDIRVTKQWISKGAGENIRKIVLRITYDNIPMELWDTRGCMDQSENEIHMAFDGMWFAFPTPFQKGDIVIRRNSVCQNYGEGPFVLTELANECGYSERWAVHGDYTDMFAWGYFQTPDNGDLYNECTCSYMDLEYYCGELTGVRRVLKALSNYLKGEIDISLYSRAYQVILEQEHAKALYPSDITEKGLMLAGLKE